MYSTCILWLAFGSPLSFQDIRINNSISYFVLGPIYFATQNNFKVIYAFEQNTNFSKKQTLVQNTNIITNFRFN